MQNITPLEIEKCFKSNSKRYQGKDNTEIFSIDLEQRVF